MAQIGSKKQWLGMGGLAAGSVVGGAAVQAVMDRSGTDAAIVTRNGLIASLGGAVIGVGGALLMPKAKIATDAFLGLAASSLGAASSIGVQHLDANLEAKSTALTQEQQDQLRSIAAVGAAPAPAAAQVAAVAPFPQRYVPSPEDSEISVGAGA